MSTSTPANQVVAVLAPLQSIDGVHQLTLSLHPAGLGAVTASLTVSGQQLTVQLAASTSAGHQALQQGLEDLRQQLSADGQQATVVLSDGRAGHHPGGSAAGHGGHNATAGSRASSPGDEPGAVPAGAGSSSAHRARVDLRL